MVKKNLIRFDVTLVEIAEWNVKVTGNQSCIVIMAVHPQGEKARSS